MTLLHNYSNSPQGCKSHVITYFHVFSGLFRAMVSLAGGLVKGGESIH